MISSLQAGNSEQNRKNTFSRTYQIDNSMTTPDPIIDFLIKDYEHKINYHTAHLTRIW